MVESSTVFKWPPLESNPEIFTTYMRKLGLPQNYAFSEVMGFDEDLLAFVPQPVVAVLCNLNYLKKTEDL